MSTLSNQILKQATERAEGTPLCAKELLHLGRRAAVDQALSRLVREGKLMRSGRGLYVLPVESRFGTRAPSAEKVVLEVAKVRGETVASSGATAANALGLTTQVPVRLIYLTSGPSRQIKLGAQTVEMKHAPRWQLIKAGETAGEAVRALAWLGPLQAQQGLAKLKHTLPKAVLEQIVESRAALPEWLARTVSSELVANG
ncbi:MAG: DUF6088 family protein [Gammaproteobacteria bacterium]